MFCTYLATMQGGSTTLGLRQSLVPSSIARAQPRLGLSSLPRSHDALPRRRQSVQILRVDRCRPAPVLHLFQAEPQVIEVMLAEEIGGAIHARRPRDRGNGVDDQLEIAFAGAHRFVRALPVVNVRQQPAPADNPAFRVAEWRASTLKPAIHPIRPPQTVFALIRRARLDRP